MTLNIYGKEMRINDMTDIQRRIAMDGYDKEDLLLVIHRLCDELNHVEGCLLGYVKCAEVSG